MFGGGTMTTQMIIRINEDTKKRLNRLARLEGKSMSQLVRELIEEHLRQRDIGAYIDDLWERIGNKLASKGVTETSIKKAIKESRKSRK
jgi:predicted DNA-binding protein